MKKILFRTGGGFGKQIMATRIVEMIKDRYPDSILHVQTSYPEAFANIPGVDKYFPYNVIPYFYEEHKDFEIMEAEPYIDIDYRQGHIHLIAAWCKMLGLQPPEKMCGQINLDDEEIEMGKRVFVENKIDRPVVAVQFFGGTSYYSPQEANDLMRPKHYRDIKVETAQEIVNLLVEKGFIVLQISLPTEPQLQNCLRLGDKDVANPRFIFSVLNQCQHAILIDSFAQHAWAALGKENAIVLWGGTDPKTLGYPTNINLANKELCTNLHCGRPNTWLSDFRGNGSPWKCVINGKCMAFESKKVVEKHEESVAKQKEAAKPELVEAEPVDDKVLKPITKTSKKRVPKK